MNQHRVEGRLAAALARAEQAEATYRSLVERLPSVTYTEALDSGKCLGVSPQVEQLLGYTQEEWMSNPGLWVDLLHPDDRDRVVESCALANRAKRPFRAEYRMLTRDGRLIWVRDEAVLVRGSEGQPLCWQGIMLDITAESVPDQALGA
jgi:PAS domain S-box-containing protein